MLPRENISGKYFCRRHDSWAVVACVKLWLDWFITINVITNKFCNFNYQLYKPWWNRPGCSVRYEPSCRRALCWGWEKSVYLGYSSLTWSRNNTVWYIDGLVQDFSISSALAMEMRYCSLALIRRYEDIVYGRAILFVCIEDISYLGIPSLWPGKFRGVFSAWWNYLLWGRAIF